ncbi:MAG: beta-lactamase family protein [Spirochaetaceae bacterium]
MNKTKFIDINKMCQKYIDQKKIAGISAIIKQDGETLYQENFGYSDLESKAPIKDDTIFRIYSMSKVITVTAALILYQEGRFSLEDKIKKYIPSFENPKVITSYKDGELKTKDSDTDITIAQLFTMTSGISYGFHDNEIDKLYREQFKIKEKSGDEVSLGSFVDLIADLPLSFEPGSDYLYSFSIDVIGRLIEVISEQKYSEFIQERILEPLNMVDTFLDPKGKESRVSSIYEWKDKSLNKVDMAPELFEMPGGGYYSTIKDMSIFCELLLNKGTINNIKILDSSTVEFMSKNHIAGDILERFQTDMKAGYGYGLGVRTLIDLERSETGSPIGEWGWDGMATTWLCIDPKNRLTAVLMLQLLPYGCFPIIRKFQKLMNKVISS